MLRREPFQIFESSLLDSHEAVRACESEPYFAYAHLLTLKNSSSPDTDIRAKAGLFFGDHLHLHALLNRPESAEEHLDDEMYIPNTEGHFTPETELPAFHPPTGHVSEKNNDIEINIPVEQTSSEPSVQITTEPVKRFTTETPLPDFRPAPASADVPPVLMIEPLHASDYFASQGIKLSEEMMGNDKLGQQLKSFTSWLKTMKKITPGQTNVNTMPNAATEHAVQSLAAKSNIDAEVLTEAMAEAYVVQEKKDKAKEIYEKLSLLNPAKSAYFAAKIDSLK